MSVPFDLEIQASVPLKCGWVVRKISARQGSDQVKLVCYYPLKEWNQELYLNLDKGTYACHLFPPFDKEDPVSIAEKVRPVLLRGIIEKVKKQEEIMQALHQLKDEMTALYNKKREEKNNPTPPPKP